LLKQWNVGPEDLICDYTGGSKPMSAAVVLALAGKGSRYVYVGGLVRNKKGLGVVQTGHEKPVEIENPWDVLGITTLRDIALLFNTCQFPAMRELAERMAGRSPGRKAFFSALAHVADGFNDWDSFQYKSALNKLRRPESTFRTMSACESHPSVAVFQKELANCLERLNAIVDAENVLAGDAGGKELGGLPLVEDIVGNALRRAEIDARYDDAVSRLYSAVEKLAKLRLASVHGIDNSSVRPENFQEPLAEKVRQLGNGQEPPYKLPLSRSYELLTLLSDPLGGTYAKNCTELDKVLNIRNMSILAHGFAPVRKETYDKLLAITLEFMDMVREDLPTFPHMDWQGLGYDEW
jgi:CRISPR-associated protein (TIGR02710 family)